MVAGVTVQSLMGVGTRFDLTGKHGTRISVVQHKDGHRELYAFEAGAEEPTAVVPLAEEQARLLGAVLAGTYVVP